MPLCDLNTLLHRAFSLQQKSAYLPTLELFDRVIVAYYKKTLSELTSLLNAGDPELLVNRLNNFLAKNWELVNGTALSYTALPDNELTLFFVEIAQFVKENIHDDEACILTILMPTVTIYPLTISDEYPTLDDSQSIHQVLKSHILGRGGNYLIPVKQLISLQSLAKRQWFNRYYDVNSHPAEMAFLNQEEYERLVQHSPYSETLAKVYTQYEINLKEQGSLLTHLQQLCRFLYLNSVDGNGNPDEAGAGAYDAIFQFNAYYMHLSDKENIPSTVKNEIELLLILSSNKDQNAAFQMKICTSTRRKELESAIRPVEEILATIGLSDEDKIRLTQEKIAKLSACQIVLAEAIRTQTYCGTDKLSLTKELMATLAVEFSITSSQDLAEFMKLSPSDIKHLEQNAGIQQQIISQFRTIQDLVLFAQLLAPEKLNAVFSLCATDLASQLLQIPGNLSTLFIKLDAKRCQIICQAIKNNLPRLFKNSYHINTVLTTLAPEQRTAIYEVMKNSLPRFINDVYDLRVVLAPLTPEQCATVCGFLNKKLPQFIKQENHIWIVILPLSAEQRLAVCIAIKDLLLNLIPINNLHDFLITYFPNDADKKKVQQLFFASLLQEIKVKVDKFNQDGLAKAENAAKIVHDELNKLSDTYYGTNPEKPSIDYNVFREAAMQAIKIAYEELKKHRGRKELFLKLGLSENQIPSVLSGINKLNEFGFFKFKTSSAITLNKIGIVLGLNNS